VPTKALLVEKMLCTSGNEAEYDGVLPAILSWANKATLSDRAKLVVLQLCLNVVSSARRGGEARGLVIGLATPLLQFAWRGVDGGSWGEDAAVRCASLLLAAELVALLPSAMIGAPAVLALHSMLMCMRATDYRVPLSQALITLHHAVIARALDDEDIRTGWPRSLPRAFDPQHASATMLLVPFLVQFVIQLRPYRTLLLPWVLAQMSRMHQPSQVRLFAHVSHHFWFN
jgi:hypothetical protein